jgi:hypothetical protein
MQKSIWELMCQPLDNERAWRPFAPSTGLIIGPDREATFFLPRGNVYPSPKRLRHQCESALSPPRWLNGNNFWEFR